MASLFEACSRCFGCTDELRISGSANQKKLVEYNIQPGDSMEDDGGWRVACPRSDPQQQFRHQSDFTDYTEILESLPSGQKWEDQKAPILPDGVQWIFPKDVKSALFSGIDPKMFTPHLNAGKADPGDVVQGELGSAWFVAALSCVSMYEELVGDVVGRFNMEKGVYEMGFYTYDGNRLSVCVDQRIPCNASGKPVFCTSKDPGELWPALVEKALAKAFGSYDALKGGSTAVGMHILTGRVPVCWAQYDNPLIREPDALWRKLKFLWEHGYIISCGWVKPTDAIGVLRVAARAAAQGGASACSALYKNMLRCCAVDTEGNSNNDGNAGPQDRTVGGHVQTRSASGGGGGLSFGEAFSLGGFITGHAYGIMHLYEVDGIRLVKFRNPWAEREWKGDWSDTSPLWKEHPKLFKEVYPHGTTEDGIFCMAIEDVAKHLELFEGVRAFDSARHLNNFWRTFRKLNPLNYIPSDPNMTMSPSRANRQPQPIQQQPQVASAPLSFQTPAQQTLSPPTNLNMSRPSVLPAGIGQRRP